jgi:hypothetical protein
MRFKENKNFIIGHLIAVALLFFLFWDNKQGRKGNSIKSYNDLSFIKGTVANKLKSDVAEQGNPYVLLRLNEFPEFKFDITEIKYKALKAREFVTETQRNDTVCLGILTYDFETKIKKIKPLRLSERFINYSFIEPYEVKANKKRYMTVEDVNEALKADKSWSWVLYVFGGFYLLFIVLVLCGVIKRQNLNGE